MSYPAHLLKVINALRGLPGVGARTAERFAFQLLAWPPSRLAELAKLIHEIPTHLKHCDTCGCLNDRPVCPFCDPSNRLMSTVCVVSSPRDVLLIEETGTYRGLYHVLGGLLSPLDGRGPEGLRIGALKKRLDNGTVEEMIIALDSTLEGDATSLFLKKEFETTSVKFSRLAFGLPMGSPLDYVDEGTLARALSGRRQFD